MPDFKFISHFNLYQYIIDKFNNRENLTWFVIKYDKDDNNYILDYSWFYLKTDLHYLSKSSDNLSIYIPIIIVRTWENQIISWDKLFEKINYKSENKIATQYISWWNDYINVWKEIVNWTWKEQTIFLNYLYVYCSLSNTWRIDAYYYDRYENNKNSDEKSERNTWKYVCKEQIWTSTGKECCTKKWEYYICNRRKWYEKCDITNCIPYITWSINLNETNCALSGLILKNNPKSIYFKLR